MADFDKKLKKSKEIIKNLFYDTHEAGGGHAFRYHHSIRVMKLCERFLDMNSFSDLDREASIVGALFHDVGKVDAVDENKRIIYGSDADLIHEEAGAEMVKDKLEGIFPDDFISKVSEIIAGQKSDNPSDEAKLVKDCDRLDNYGYLQFHRHGTYSVYDEKTIEEVLDYWLEEEREKAKDFLDKFYFEKTRDIAEKRFKKTDKMFKEMKKEHNVEDF